MLNDFAAARRSLRCSDAREPELSLIHALKDNSVRFDRPPILLVHGYTSGAWIFGDFYIPQLIASGWEVFALDLRGHGKSGQIKPLRENRYTDYQKDLQRAVNFIERETLAAPIIIGHSLGSVLARDYAQFSPVSGLGVLSFGDLKPAMTGFMKWMLRRFPIKTLMGMMTGRSSKLWSEFEPQYQLLFAGQPRESVAQYVAKFQLQPESDKIFLDLMGLGILPKTQVNCPVLVMAGTKDPAASSDAIKKLSAGYGVKPVTIEGAAHDLFLGKYREDSFLHLEKWLENCKKMANPT